MKTFAEKINVLVQKGYREDAARAKVAHDAVLMAMRKAGFESSSTIKGGVVMSHITADIRRTTMDMDIAFIHRSISELSIRRFVCKEEDYPAVAASLKRTFSSRTFVRKLLSSKANWLQIKPEVAMTGIVDFVLNLGK